jgi:hypothetical protein
MPQVPGRTPEAKDCPKCGLTQLRGAFGTNRSRPDGLSFYCKACSRAIAKAFYREKRAAQGLEIREPDASPPGFKRCSRCREVKKLDEFHRQATQARAQNTYCKPCRKVIQAETHLQRTYGLARAELQALIAAQDGLCAICETKPAVHVDHDHVMGKIRGVLCFTCNVALGQLKDDVALFRKAIDYLETTTWQKTLECPGVYRLTSPRPAAAASSTSWDRLRRISSRPA